MSHNIRFNSTSLPVADLSPPESSHTPPVMGAQPEVEQASGGGFQVFPLNAAGKGTGNISDSSSVAGHSGGIALSIVIVIGICFLVLNVCACAGVFYQRDRVRFKEILLQRQYKVRSADQADPTLAAQAGQASLVSQRVDDDDVEGSANCMKGGLPHQVSTSTMDPHTKVSQWMAQEITVERCPTPPIEQRNRLAKPALAKLGGSDRYDPRLCETEDVAMFPLLTKSNKASDIRGLVPVTEEVGVDHPKTGRNVSAPEFYRTVEKESKATGPDGRADSAQTTSRTSTGRRKPRTKSQLSLQRSITKRDVAVGGSDDEGDYQANDVVGESPAGEERRLSSSAYATLDTTTIRRLNLPKVLPDLPFQDVPAGATISSKRTNAPSNSSSPIYTIPSGGLGTCVDSGERHASKNRPHQRQSESPLTSTGSDAKQQLQGRRQYLGNPIAVAGEASVAASTGASTAGEESATTSSAAVVKTNLPQTLVVAPHPRAMTARRATGQHNNVTTAAPLAEPEPCLVIRPGPARQQQPRAAAAGGGSDCDETDSSAARDVVQLRHQTNKQGQGASRPASRNSRSWYAQYSQSFISQSVDQQEESDATNETWFDSSRPALNNETLVESRQKPLTNAAAQRRPLPRNCTSSHLARISVY